MFYAVADCASIFRTRNLSIMCQAREEDQVWRTAAVMLHGLTASHEGREGAKSTKKMRVTVQIQAVCSYRCVVFFVGFVAS